MPDYFRGVVIFLVLNILYIYYIYNVLKIREVVKLL